jgi:hypothetical protein
VTGATHRDRSQVGGWQALAASLDRIQRAAAVILSAIVPAG